MENTNLYLNRAWEGRPSSSGRGNKRVPVYIFSCYSNTSQMVVFSHGFYDKWAVFLAEPVDLINVDFNADYLLCDDYVDVTKGESKSDFEGYFEDLFHLKYRFKFINDIDCFSRMRDFAKKLGPKQVWQDFWDVAVSIPMVRNTLPTPAQAELIYSISKKYDEPDAREVFDILLCAMIAENNKERSILGKKIKVVSMKKVIDTDESIEEIIRVHRNSTWKDIELEAEELGIYIPTLDGSKLRASDRRKV